MPRKIDREEFHFEGFTFPNTTPVPDEFFDVLAPYLSEAELRVLLYIIRRTFGFKKHSDNISIRQLCEGITKKDGAVLDQGTGLSKPAVTKAVKSLVKKNVLIATRRSSPERGYEASSYSLNIRVPYPMLTKLTSPSKLGLPPLVNLVNPQQTVLQQTDTTTDAKVEKGNHHSSGELDPKADVVVALIDRGLSQQVADRLAHRYRRDRIFEKIDYLKYIQEHQPEKVTQPRGWLRRAIEQNYSAPDGYKTKAEREAEAAEKERRRQEQAAAAVEAEQEAATRRAREQAAQARRLAALQQSYGTTQLELDVWPQVLAELKLSLTKATYEAWFPRTQLLSLAGGEALVAVPNEVTREWLEQRLTDKIKRALSNAGQPVERLKFEVLTGDG